ncbi:GNAT family N-acetyltransferase [Chelatococcus asaccharovorans]|uniref:Ribosomal protein S18 acetylase RimI-like enzyme n=1 Tax=Chelatococcus asaccharovorans TaxID=28210 RepID=A0A2V3TU24_9HYPH|nr:GNAT family N-acetyltransferase [Chelatococcus asaccharovorans]MBS7704858.1 GNAT family N-acetyltransferase [Chelatococcus asaccharovorans]PXW51321.1 ribosomal protein S18 acetylase RimI-like enzyme [Chelatococcus asaccharovorans]
MTCETSGVAVRSVAPAEAEARASELADLLVDAVAGGASVNFLADFTHEDALAFWRGQFAGLADGSRRLFVADDGQRLLGTVVLTFAPQPNAPHRAEIGKMLVHSDARRQGLGARLLTAAEQAALANGRTLLLLDTASGSAGEQLYRRCGWTEYGVVPDHAHTPDGVLAPTTFFFKHLTAR